MTLLTLYAQRLRRRRAHHHNQLPSQARTTEHYCCRRCDKIFFTPPFISYKDGHTKICSDCSLIEDMEAAGIKAPYDGFQYWTIEQHLRATAAEGLATRRVNSSPAACRPPAPREAPGDLDPGQQLVGECPLGSVA